MGSHFSQWTVCATVQGNVLSFLRGKTRFWGQQFCAPCLNDHLLFENASNLDPALFVGGFCLRSPFITMAKMVCIMHDWVMSSSLIFIGEPSFPFINQKVGMNHLTWLKFGRKKYLVFAHKPIRPLKYWQNSKRFKWSVNFRKMRLESWKKSLAVQRTMINGI